MTAAEPSRCGQVALVGRPNVGKSTLLNHILGRKISITSRKPQTTRHQVLGIKTLGSAQLVFVDTPGLRRKAPKAINRWMNRAAASAIKEVDVAVMVVDRTAWEDGDKLVLERLGEAPGLPVILAINKIDLMRDKGALLPHLKFLSEQGDFREILPVSALRGHNLEALENCIRAQLPEAEHLFPPGQATDCSRQFLAAEIVREKIMRQTGDEVLYAATVTIDGFRERPQALHISALIYVEREGQKRILVGKEGARLRSIGEDARKDLEKLFDTKVMLRLWVKLRRGWSDDERALRSLGYGG